MHHKLRGETWVMARGARNPFYTLNHHVWDTHHTPHTERRLVNLFGSKLGNHLPSYSLCIYINFTPHLGFLLILDLWMAVLKMRQKMKENKTDGETERDRKDNRWERKSLILAKCYVLLSSCGPHCCHTAQIKPSRPPQPSVNRSGVVVMDTKDNCSKLRHGLKESGHISVSLRLWTTTTPVFFLTLGVYQNSGKNITLLHSMAFNITTAGLQCPTIRVK